MSKFEQIVEDIHFIFYPKYEKNLIKDCCGITLAKGKDNIEVSRKLITEKLGSAYDAIILTDKFYELIILI